MQHGDLAVSSRPSYVVVLEGVLAEVTPITRPRRLRGDQIVGYNLHWLDIPLRRMATLKRRFPEFSVDIITFLNEDVAEDAAAFLTGARIPFDSMASTSRFDTWVSLLPFRVDEGLQAVYDSDPERLERYGQLGRAVVKGGDW